MAGEWIKMRTNLWDDPRVSSLCDLTGQPEAMVIGGLYWLWAMADEHTEDGFLPGLTLRAIGRKTGVAGLGEAMVQIGWLEADDAVVGVRVVNFAEHNGASAKRRSMDAKRKTTVRKVSASDADKKRNECGARVREENINPSLTPGAPISMHLEWSPPDNLLAAYALRSGMTANLFTPDAIGPFVIHHAAKQTTRPESEHVAALVAWVKRDQVSASRVVPLRAKAAQEYSDKETGWLGGGA